jgi:hypothetical protein
VARNPVPFEAWNLVRYLGFDDWDLGFAAPGSVGVTDDLGAASCLPWGIAPRIQIAV